MALSTIAGKASTYGDSCAGFSYIAVLLMVLVLSLAMAMAAEPIATSSQRDKEAELLFIGDQYRNAIASYYKSAPDGLSVLPMKLEDLVVDKRFIAPTHHLRRLYADPLSPSQQWGLIKNPQDQLIGVYSLAPGTPLLVQPRMDSAAEMPAGMERAGFSKPGELRDELQRSEQGASKAGSYAEWKFIFVPNQQGAQAVSNN